MSDSLFKLFGGAVLCVILIIILKRESPDTALTFRMIAGVGLAIACLSSISPIIDYIKELCESFSGGEGLSDSVSVLLKALGVSLLTHICATVCRDAGEGSLAYYVEVGGKVEILILSLPLIKQIMDLAIELLEMG